MYGGQAAIAARHPQTEQLALHMLSRTMSLRSTTAALQAADSGLLIARSLVLQGVPSRGGPLTGDGRMEER
jgi:hypothetical protein